MTEESPRSPDKADIIRNKILSLGKLFDNDTQKINEVITTIIGEISCGAGEIYIFGSRAKEQHTTASDVDILVINPKADGKRIRYEERFGSTNYFGKPGEQYLPWIHVSRVNDRVMSKQPKEKRQALQRALKAGILIWEKRQ